MPAPAALIDEVRMISAAQEVDADEAMRALGVLLDDDECISYRVWGGPGFGQETVLIDVYVLGEFALYNYSVFKEYKQESCIFLDTIETIALVTVDHPRSPYVLIILASAPEERCRIFGGAGDLQRLEAFRSEIISARRKNREE